MRGGGWVVEVFLGGPLGTQEVFVFSFFYDLFSAQLIIECIAIAYEMNFKKMLKKVTTPYDLSKNIFFFFLKISWLANFQSLKFVLGSKLSMRDKLLNRSFSLSLSFSLFFLSLYV